MISNIAKGSSVKRLIAGMVVTMFIFAGSAVAGSSVYTEQLHFTPDGNGYVVDATYRYAFRNCAGDLNMESDLKTTSSSYKYKGKIYTSSEIGYPFTATNPGTSGPDDIHADLYNGGAYLGAVKHTNIINFGGCLGDTANLTTQINQPFKNFKNSLNALRLSNIRLTLSLPIDYKVEGKIEAYISKQQYTQKIKAADNLYASNKLEDAMAAYTEAKRYEPSGTNYAQSKIGEIKKRIADKKRQAAEAESARREKERATASAQAGSKATEHTAQAGNSGYADRQKSAWEKERERREAWQEKERLRKEQYEREQARIKKAQLEAIERQRRINERQVQQTQQSYNNAAASIANAGPGTDLLGPFIGILAATIYIVMFL